MNTEIKSIPHNEHRYETVGDYWEENGVLKIRVSETGNEDYHFLVSVHEMVEEYLTRRRGLAEPDIKAFDEMFEAEREAGKHGPEAEPGFDPRAPYLREHTIATAIEMMLAGHMGLDWSTYEKVLMGL